MLNRGNYASQAKNTGTSGMNSYHYKNLNLEFTSWHGYQLAEKIVKNHVVQLGD